MGMSHTVTAVAPTAADSWTAVGTITVPAGAKSIKNVTVGYVHDAGTSAATVHSAPVFRMIGSGLLEQSPHEYVGPGDDSMLIASTVTGYPTTNTNPVHYDVDIPVSTGGTIDVQCNSLDEIATGQVYAMLTFSPEPSAGRNSMSQYVDAPIPGAADAWTTVGTITVPQAKEGASPTSIREIVMQFVPDVAATAVSERVATRIRLSGAGIAEPGNHEFISTGQGNGCVVSGSSSYDNLLVRYKTNIPVSSGGSILVETIHDTEVCDGGTTVVGVLYS
jgi:hypothetical protein